MENDLIEVQLSVDIKKDIIEVDLLFQNKSGKKIYLDKQTIYYNGVVRNNYFEITNKEDDEVDYLGMMANCTLLPEDFIELGPGEKIHTSISLNDFYELTKGNVYSIQYYAYNPSFLKEQQHMQMESNKVEIVY